jgi:ABC-type glycerol-3-phosphate transport system substrate-binding protein
MNGYNSRITRRRFLQLAGTGAGALALGACGAPAGEAVPTTGPTAAAAGGPTVAAGAPTPTPTPTPIPPREAAAGRKTVIELYSVFSGKEHAGWIKTAEAFEASQADIGVKITYSPGHAENPKLLTAVAGGAAPDLAQMTPFSTPQYVELGVMTEITPYMQEAGLTQDQFFTPAWNDMNYQGKIWQMQWDADPNFPFFWNKQIFEDVGLDPDKPPKTIEEVDAYTAKINQTKGGRVTRIGIIPWDQYGFGNSLFTWGWAFGGEFYDPSKEEVTPDNDYVVKALEWMAASAKKVGGPEKVSVTPPNLQLHPFGAGNIGMSALVVPNYVDIKKNAKFEIGTGLLPYAPPGAKAPGAGAWFGGWALFIPRGAKNPDAAFQFMKYVSATKEGTLQQYKTVGFPPAWKPSPALDQMKNDATLKPYYDVVTTAQHSRPAIPAGAFYFSELDRLVSEVVNGKKQAGAAMKEAKQRTMKEMERVKTQGLRFQIAVPAAL